MNILGIQLFFDSHTHSNNSFDAKSSVIEMCNQAILKGLSGMAVTDHCEANEFYLPNYSERVYQSYSDAVKAKQEFEGKLKVIKGIELGQPTQDLKASEQILSDNDYDFVLASVHNLKGFQDFYFMEYKNVDPDALVADYMKEMLETVAWGKFDSLAHLTYPLRYICGEAGLSVDMKVLSGTIDEIFVELIKRDKALEVNSSGLRQKIGTTLPDYQYLKRYYDLGGRLVTIGSDAHNTEHLAFGLDGAVEVLKSAGFKNYCYFEKRTPIFVPIV